MKKVKRSGKNKSLNGFTKCSGEFTKGSGEFTKSRSEFIKSSGDINKTSGVFTRSSGELTRVRGEKNLSVVIMDIILLALSATNLDYIPHADGDFDEWQKNFVTHLGLPWPPAGDAPPPPSAAIAAAAPSPLYVFLGIPVERYNKILEEQAQWNKDFARGGKEADRRSSETKAKQKTRDDYESMIRKLCKQYILYNDKTTDEIKRALKLTVPDTEPSPVHGTEAPAIQLKNLGGAFIDVTCRRKNDKSRPSMLKGYQAEVRWWALEKTADTPKDPETPGYSFAISGKAHFKVETGMANLGKTFYCYVRWRSKTDTKFNSPWTNLLQIIIS